jgi:DNA-directed RNA polymerase subunit H (RpoH/RPB5)
MFVMFKTAFELLKFRSKLDENAVGTIESMDNIKSSSELKTYLQSNDKRVIIKAKNMQVIIFEPESLAMRSNGLHKLFNQYIDRHSIFILPKTQDFNSVITYLIKLRGAGKPDVNTMELFNAGGACPYRIEMNVYSVIMFNMPTHVLFTKYELATQDEKEKWVATSERSLSKLPTISVYDTALFWHGFKEHEVVIENKLSPTSGKAPLLKVVVNLHSSKGARAKKLKATQ